jgi:hypothetical protein
VCECVAFSEPHGPVDKDKSTNSSSTPAAVRAQRPLDLFQIQSYVGTRKCRSRFVAEAMGDDLLSIDFTNCECDNCAFNRSDANGETAVDFGYEIASLAQTIRETGGRLSIAGIVAITTAPAKMPKCVAHITNTDDCSTYGSLKFRRQVSTGGGNWRGRSVRELKSLCLALQSRDPPLFQPSTGSEKQGGISLTTLARDYLDSHPFTQQKLQFQGEFKLVKPAIMNAKRAKKAPSTSAKLIERSRALRSALWPTISTLATEHDVPSSLVIPDTAFNVLASIERSAVPSCDDLFKMKTTVGGLFDALPDIWNNFANAVIRCLSMSDAELAKHAQTDSEVPNKQSQRANPETRSQSAAPKAAAKPRSKPIHNPDKENAPNKSKSKPRKLVDGPFVPPRQLSHEKQSDSHARLVYELSAPGSKPLSMLQPKALPVFTMSTQHVSQRQPARKSAQASAFVMEAMSTAQKKKARRLSASTNGATGKKSKLTPLATRQIVLQEVAIECLSLAQTL